VGKFIGNSILMVVSIAFCVAMAEIATRIIDGLPAVAVEMPSQMGSLGRDTTGGHLDQIPRAPGIDRALFFTEPPPLSNRKPVAQEWLDLDKQVRDHPIMADTGTAFLPWDMFKAWNAVFVGDPCKHPYLKAAPGRLWVYDPPDGKIRPTFRYLPNFTAPDGLVTNEIGWRGPPVSLQKPPKTVRIVMVGASTMAEIHHYPFSSPEYIQAWLNKWAEDKKLDVRFEVLNAGRESVNSNDIEAIVREEALPLRPDMIFYYEGGNQLDLSTVVKDVPKATPMPAGWLARFLREAAQYSAIARRAESLMPGGEWPRPPYTLTWPQGLSESDPDLTRKDLPVHLNNIMDNLDKIRAELDKVGGLLSIGSFHWLAKDGLVLDASRYKPILYTLNVTYFPYRYRDLERLTKFENTVYAKYAKEHGLPFIDVVKYMPNDPDLFSDAIHNTPAGVKLRGWIVLQQLMPVIEAKLKSGEWPKPVAADAPAPAPYKPREIKFNCKAS
jgi:hypothetical protein